MQVKMRFDRAPWVAALVVWVGILHGCQSAAVDTAGTSPDTMFIGVATLRPDPGPSPGVPFNRNIGGVEIAVSHLNLQRTNSTAVFARWSPPPDPTPADRPEPAVEIAAAFRDHPGVIGVVGHGWSSQVLEAAPVYGDVEGGERRALVAISPTATSPSVTAASRWVFRVCPTDHDAARALARYAADATGIRRAAIIYRNDVFGRGFRSSFRDAFDAVGGKIVAEDPYVPRHTNLAPFLERVSQRGVDGLVLAGVSEALDVLRFLDELELDIPVFGTDGLAELAYDPAARLSAANVRYVAFYLPERNQTPENRRFRHDYLARYGTLPDHVAALSYDAAMLIGSAALEVGPDRHRIRDWIAARGQSEPVFAGATGPIRFNHQGDVVEKPVLIAEIGR